MKVKIISLLLMAPFMVICQVPFTADMINVRNGNERNYSLQSDGSRYRYDFDESGMKGIVIVDPQAKKTAILMPDEKFVHYTDPESRMSLMNDPYQSYLYTKATYTEKSIGKESMYGFDCEKSELYASDQLLFTAWYSSELGFLIKLVNNNSENTYMELHNIKKGKIDPGGFNVPEDYTEVDERMRPIIPEPPPPDSWITKELVIPFTGEFKRGEIVSFTVPESKNYKILLTNETSEPAKIIRISMRDGKELPDNEQGPIKYRTNRLFAGESKKDTYSWKAGDVKILKIHEGKLHIEIVEE